jgi:ABC-2 type transport system permease protein
VRLRNVRTGWLLTLRELGRSRIALILCFVVPSVFYAIVFLITSDRPILFKLASVAEDAVVSVSQRNEGLVFIGLAAVGVLTSFLALHLTQKNPEVNRRLILCGYGTTELLASKFLALVVMIGLIGCYVGAITPVFFRPQRFLLVLAGFMAAGYVYGSYGLLVGALVKRELEGILFIVLLANIDIGWLQNPIYYAEAQNKALIRHLPAYFPSQLSMVSAFTDKAVLNPALGSLAYGTVLLAAALIIYSRRMRLRK